MGQIPQSEKNFFSVPVFLLCRHPVLGPINVILLAEVVELAQVSEKSFPVSGVPLRKIDWQLLKIGDDSAILAKIANENSRGSCLPRTYFVNARPLTLIRN